MKIGIPKEIKNNESRVGMTPAGVAELIRHGHQVFVQHTAGINSGFSDEKYETVGAKILPDIASVYNEAEMIIKVKEPIEQEYKLIKQDQLVFTYFHFACDRQLTEAMIKTGAVCLAYETVETDDHKLPLLIPMSEVAGRMATLNGAYYLQKTKGGKGKLISGVPGVDRVKGSGMRRFEATALINGNIYKDGPRLHHLQHFSGDEVGRFVARNQYAANNDINVGQHYLDIVCSRV